MIEAKSPLYMTSSCSRKFHFIAKNNWEHQTVLDQVFRRSQHLATVNIPAQRIAGYTSSMLPMMRE